MIIFNQLYERIIGDLEENLPLYLTYHSPNHTKLVLQKTILIAEKEKISDDELFLLKIAALYHDTGYKASNENHETESCRIANKELSELGLATAEIEQICGMIMATKIPQQPKTHLEGILADADLEYLGTSKFEAISNKLLAEMKYFKPDLTLKEWYDIQIRFIHKHHYHTEFCRKNREPEKLKNLENLQKKARLL